MILVGVGSNLAAPRHASPLHTAIAALRQLPGAGVAVRCRSHWYLSEPVPPSGQPWFVNAVLIVETPLAPDGLLSVLLALEARFGRRRSVPNAARTLDLDLLDYRGERWRTPRLALPHPRLQQRRFVLAPLAEIAPRWRHPELGLTASEMLARLPAGQPVRRLREADRRRR